MLEATGKAMSYGQSPPTTMATLPTLIAIGKALPSADKFLGLMAVNVKIGDRRELPVRRIATAPCCPNCQRCRLMLARHPDDN